MATGLVVAAGSGERLGVGEPKAIVELSGRPLIAWTMRALAAAPSIDAVAIAAPAGYEARIEALAVEAAPALRLCVTTGGASRSESVLRALDAAPPSDVVLVHDAARPLVTADLIEKCVNELQRLGCDAVVAAAAVTDTVKRVSGDRVTETLDRGSLRAIQTPQAFAAPALRAALESAGDLEVATDDAKLVEDRGDDVRVVDAPLANIKVTTAADLELARILLANAASHAD